MTITEYFSDFFGGDRAFWWEMEHQGGAFWGGNKSIMYKSLVQ